MNSTESSMENIGVSTLAELELGNAGMKSILSSVPELEYDCIACL